MDLALPYLSFCYPQRNGFTQIFQVLQLSGTIANSAWPNRKLKFKMAAII